MQVACGRWNLDPEYMPVERLGRQGHHGQHGVLEARSIHHARELDHVLLDGGRLHLLLE